MYLLMRHTSSLRLLGTGSSNPLVVYQTRVFCLFRVSCGLTASPSPRRSFCALPAGCTMTMTTTMTMILPILVGCLRWLGWVGGWVIHGCDSLQYRRMREVPMLACVSVALYWVFYCCVFSLRMSAALFYTVAPLPDLTSCTQRMRVLCRQHFLSTFSPVMQYIRDAMMLTTWTTTMANDDGNDTAERDEGCLSTPRWAVTCSSSTTAATAAPGAAPPPAPSTRTCRRWWSTSASKSG